MKVIHVTESLEPEYGGPAKSVPDLAASLQNAGVEVTLVATQKGVGVRYGLVEDYGLESRIAAVAVSSRVPFLGRWYFAPAMKAVLREESRRASLIHFTGLWSYPARQSWAAARRRGIPLVYSARASLYPASLAHHPVRKKLAWSLWVKRLLHGCACLHATSHVELESYRALGLPNPIALISNGVNTEEFAAPMPRAEARRGLGVPETGNYMLFLGRITPLKRPDWLVEIWSALSDRFPDWSLLVAGPVEDQAYARRVREMAEPLRRNGRIHDLGMLDRERRRLALEASDLFVVPTARENFGTAISEGLAARRPVITTDGAPWKMLPELGAGWCIEQTRDALRDALTEALTKPADDLRQMGLRGRTLVEGMSLERRAEQMLGTYRWLLGQGTAPDFVDR